MTEEVPSHILEAIKQGRHLDLKDPYVRKIVREINREKREKEELKGGEMK
tara:strand:+ start:318 stop:467 length:150 start_codon:yes stop_codon:yes gene_type:complete